MCISWKKHIAAVLLLLCLPVVMAGCGGGGGGGNTAVVSGIATKGAIVGGAVSVYQLQQDGTRGARMGQGVTGAGGSYSVAVPASFTGPMVVTVTGRPGATYTSETTGRDDVKFTAADSFSAVATSFTPGVNITVSPLTEMAFQKLPLILAAKPGALSADKLTSSISAANAQVGALFNISDILAAPSSSPSYDAVLRVIDQMVENSKLGGAITDTTAVMTVLTQGIANVDAPAYQTFLSVFTTAADQVKAANSGTIASLLNAIAVQLADPTEPTWTDVEAPDAVTGLSAITAAVTATTSSVTLSWNATTDRGGAGLSGYDVYRDGNKVGTATGTTFTDPSVTSNVTYLYTVVAFDAAGNRSAASQALSVTPNQPSLNVTVSGTLSNELLSQLDIAAPTAPTALSAVATAVTGTTSSVALSWTAATDNVAVTGYDVYRDGVKIGSATSTSYTDPSVTSATLYSYTVKAYDAAGNRSAFSTALSVTPNRPSLGVTLGGQISL